MTDTVELKVREFFNSEIHPFLIMKTVLSDKRLVKLYTQCVAIMSLISEDDYPELYDGIADWTIDLQTEILRRMATKESEE